MAVHEYRPAAPQKKPPPPFRVPWGLFVVLAIYALAVVGYVWKTYWESPEYQAAEHYARALALLGVDDGRKCSQSDLERAFGHVLEAARLIPENKALSEHTERLRWRFDERGFQLNKDFTRKAELVSKAAQRVEEERSPWLAVGSRERGWAPDQLLSAPTRVLWWSSPGFVLIIAVWVYGQFNARRVREREHEEALRAQEAENERLGDWRRGLGSREADDDATIAEPPRRSTTRPVQQPGERKSVKSSPGRPAAARARSSPSRPAVKRTTGEDE